tara:strand:- start:137 stop:502 length:366 start_codon:yes stop_codon:yes gene_type:complete
MSDYATKIVTNGHERHFLYRDEVPASILESQFDWLDEDTFDGFIFYRKTWYHLGDFMRFQGTAWIASPQAGSKSTEVNSDQWDGYHGDSFFSGVLVKISDDCETYKIGTYFQVSTAMEAAA